MLNDTSEQSSLEQAAAESPPKILEQTNIGAYPVFAEGNEKRFRMAHTLPDETKKVIAEYIHQTTNEWLQAAFHQQRILHLLFPDYFPQVYEAMIGSDDTARIVVDFIEIDPTKSINPTGPGAGQRINSTIAYIQRVKTLPDFQALATELTKIGVIPSKEESPWGAANEIAGGAVFDKTGRLVVVDIVSPLAEIYEGDEHVTRPRLKVAETRQLAKDHGVSTETDKELAEYEKNVALIMKA